MIEIPGYRILRQLGRGGMATVYLAMQESVDRDVALKVMSPALLADPNFGERFLREAQIAAKLHHRHVVGIHDVGRSDDFHYIAMEYLGGGPVLTRDGTERSAAFALRITREIASALNYAHEKGFIHRDVKPDNILLRDDQSSALTDFGIARAVDNAFTMTKTGAVVGTPHYMSPEQARGKQIDGRSDLYALGIVLFEMLVGRVPYHADDSLAIGIMHITQPVPELPRNLAVLQPLMTQLLAKQPDDRFQTGNDVAAAVAEIEARIDDGELPSLPVLPGIVRREATPIETLTDTSVATLHARDRAEPSLGRLDQIVAAIDGDAPRASRAHSPHAEGAGVMRAERNDSRADDDALLEGNGYVEVRPPGVMRAERQRTSRSGARARPSRGGWIGLFVLLLIGVAGFAAWNWQDRLRALLPRTEFNDSLSRAQRALDAGHLTGSSGDSAKELFLAARAQDPDNDTARRGVDAVGSKLVERARQAMKSGDLASARQSIDAARELLGGGSEVDRIDAELRQTEARGSETSQLLDQAQAALAAGHIVGSDGAAAIYQRIQASGEASTIALAGLQKCADALAGQARSALATGNVELASERGDDIARVLPSYAGLPTLRGELSQAREHANSALDDILRHADDQLHAGHLTGGDDAALALYRSVLKLDPGNRRARQGLRDIARGLVVQANAAIDGDSPERAQALLGEAAGLAPDLADLRAAKANLREWRERHDIDSRRGAPTAEQSVEVRKLVDEADAAAVTGQLIVPPGVSAYDKYRAALAIDGNDRAANDGMAKLPARAKSLFARALTDGAPLRARSLLDTIREIAPDDADLGGLGEKLANAFLDQADARIGEGRSADASRALDAARELSPNNARIVALAARIEALGSPASGAH